MRGALAVLMDSLLFSGNFNVFQKRTQDLAKGK